MSETLNEAWLLILHPVYTLLFSVLKFEKPGNITVSKRKERGTLSKPLIPPDLYKQSRESLRIHSVCSHTYLWNEKYTPHTLKDLSPWNWPAISTALPVFNLISSCYVAHVHTGRGDFTAIKPAPHCTASGYFYAALAQRAPARVDGTVHVHTSRGKGEVNVPLH